MLLVMQRSAFLSVLENEPILARHIIELLCERMRLKTDLLSDFAFADLPVRLARKLGRPGDGPRRDRRQRGAGSGKRFSQTELAQMLGVSREAINKQLAAWSHKGIVSTEDGGLTILDLATLRAHAAVDRIDPV